MHGVKSAILLPRFSLYGFVSVLISFKLDWHQQNSNLRPWPVVHKSVITEASALHVEAALHARYAVRIGLCSVEGLLALLYIHI
jgi:hypothetical protein